jgi:hypothetical protein
MECGKNKSFCFHHILFIEHGLCGIVCCSKIILVIVGFKPKAFKRTNWPNLNLKKFYSFLFLPLS